MELNEFSVGHANPQFVDGFLLGLSELHLRRVDARAVVAVVAHERAVADLTTCDRLGWRGSGGFGGSGVGSCG